jgi:hypothetical protein
LGKKRGPPNILGETSVTKIFISHSQDDPNLGFFHKAFSATEVKAIWMEFEDITPPAWATIAKNVRESSSLFVILNKSLNQDQYEHTKNWVSFEVGLACMAKKPVWVFEPFDEEILFVVPYLTHLAKFEPDNREHLKILKNWVESHGLVPKPNSYLEIESPSCNINFNLFTAIEKFSCPNCRAGLERDMHIESDFYD